MKVEVTTMGDVTELKLSNDSSQKAFESLAEAVQAVSSGRWIERLDGLDQSYWNLRVGECTLTLHREHYLGVSLYVALGSADSDAAIETLTQIGVKLSARQDCV